MNNFSKRIYFVVLFIVLSIFPVNGLLAQQKTSKVVDPADAKEHFSHNNFLFAIPAYKQLLKQEPNNPDYNYKLGICYLYTNINKSLSIPHLEIASKAPKTEKKVLYHLGLAYQYASRFDDAIKTYNAYKATLKGAELEEVDHQIETCENGKEYVKHPINVSFQNLGKEINSEYPDYYPFVPANESFVVFTSRRKDNIGGQVEVDGYYSSDIYMSLPVNDIWTKPKNMGGTVNTRYDEQAVGLTPDGQTMLMYIDHIDSLGNIYSSMNKAGTFQRMRKLNNNVNSDFETAGSITPDGNIIFFTSKREGGLGETDVYMARKLPNGQWAKAQNLGNVINTKYKEDFPQIAPDGKTLYFSSQGHAGMGDFDLYQSTWNEEENTWTTPKNLGYPINSVGDDRCISFTENNRVAYISAVRDGGFGDLDLYRVKFDDIEDRTTVLQGYISTVDSAKNISTFVTVRDLKNKDASELTYNPNPNTGKFIMALTPSKYEITIEADGYKTLTDAFFIFDIGIGQNESKKFFTLQK
ncbi:MAG: PD40 domain-containing protein [Bacteroidetes bacterium]|nr:PD40 domain-containing protein [Bacteroidota bacterium]